MDDSFIEIDPICRGNSPIFDFNNTSAMRRVRANVIQFREASLAFSSNAEENAAIQSLLTSTSTPLHKGLLLYVVGAVRLEARCILRQFRCKR